MSWMRISSVPGDWSWGFDKKTTKVAFRALRNGLQVIFAEGPPVGQGGEPLREWVHTLVAHLQANGLAQTGFPAEDLIASARDTFEQVHGLSWGTGS